MDKLDKRMEDKLYVSQDTQTCGPNERFVYESSNGDRWYLCESPTTKLPAVKHIANPQSGEQISYLEVESFLSSGAGPEHEALRRLIKQERTSTFLIAYDVHTRQDSEYHELAETIKSFGAWWHHLETVWIIRSDKTPGEIRDTLTAQIGADDQLFVVDITGAAAEWVGVNGPGSSWLRANINSDLVVA
jgi:hypothetical protein